MRLIRWWQMRRVMRQIVKRQARSAEVLGMVLRALQVSGPYRDEFRKALGVISAEDVAHKIRTSQPRREAMLHNARRGMN